MKKNRFLPIVFLLLASLACNWVGFSRAPQSEPAVQTEAKQPETAEQTEAPQSQATKSSPTQTLSPPEQKSPAVVAATETVLMPSIPIGGAASGSAEQPAGPPDPRVEITLSSLSIHPGETITLTGTPVDIDTMVYVLIVRDEGVQDTPAMAQVTTENGATALPGVSRVVEYISASGEPGQVVFVLRGKAPGVTTVTLSAAGQIPGGNGASVDGSGSGDVMITVVP